MKSISRRLLSFLLCVLLVGVSALLPGMDMPVQLGMTARAAGGNFYMINGKALSYDSVVDPGQGNNSDYIKSLYEYVWDVNYTDDFSSTDNILKNLVYEERALNPDNLKTYVQRCQPGSVMKIETEEAGNTNNENGYTVFIVF